MGIVRLNPWHSAVLLLAASPLLGQQRLVQELARSEVVFPQERDELQITLAPAWSRATGFESELALEYGITSSWQIGMNARGVLPGSKAWGDALEIGIKRSFMNLRGSGTHLALGFEAEMERAVHDGEDELEIAPESAGVLYRPFLVLATDVAKGRGHLFGEIGLALRANDQRWNPGRHAEPDWGVGGIFRTGPVVLTQEFTWASPEGRLAAGKDVYWTPGLVWRLPWEDTWEIAAAVSVGLAGHMDSACVILKLTREFENVGRLFRK